MTEEPYDRGRGRPDPDALLARTKGRGRLKVFLGMAPGVGKTTEMLRAARRRKAEGAEVLVGVVETHGRKETAALLRGMEVLARKPFEHRGRTLLEFDIDAALARRPGLLLVDEYAHSNVPGSRHPKRWQDVEEILAAGIDVWTTLNVQHLESLVDVTQRITGVRQRETVPDVALSRADEIEVVDITPSELRQRLADGKVYVPETARLAAERFFKSENLTALRELALRRAAQTVDDQLQGEMKRAGVEGPWAAGERILVLVGGDAMAAPLVRAGRRLSDMMMDAPWTVAHVERPNAPILGDAAAARLAEALKLAEQLGAATVALTGDDLVRAALDYARRSNVTQIVLGRSRRGAWDAWWRASRGLSLPHAFLDRAAGAALHIVTDEAGGAAPPEAERRPGGRWGWRGYAAGAGLVVAAGLLSHLLDQRFERANLAMLFLTAVLVSGVLYGLRPALAAATVAFLTYNFFFLDPRFSFSIGAPTDVLTLFVFWGAALATGGLAGRVRDQAHATSQRASAFASLLAFSRRLSSAATRAEAAQALVEQLAATVRGRAVALLPDGEGIVPVAGSPALEALGAGDMAAARWAWERGEAAGAGTGTLPNAAWTFHPLQGVRTRSGVVGIEGTRVPGREAERFAMALVDQGAVAIERAALAADAVEAEAWRRSDRLRSALLNSISHDLRTPLSTVLGSATTLIDYGATLDTAVTADLLDSIREEAERLGRYVGDLLDMTRLEGGALDPRRDLTDVRDVLDAAAARVTRRLGARTLARDYPPDLSFVMLDATLLEQAIVNILENAIAYSPDGSAIEMAVHEDRGNVVVSIEDEGRGIPTADLARVFDKFRRLEATGDRRGADRRGERAGEAGVGLGLSISKGFVEAMGGRIAAASPIREGPGGEGRGTRVLVSLPKSALAPGAPPAPGAPA